MPKKWCDGYEIELVGYLLSGYLIIYVPQQAEQQSPNIWLNVIDIAPLDSKLSSLLLAKQGKFVHSLLNGTIKKCRSKRKFGRPCHLTFDKLIAEECQDVLVMLIGAERGRANTRDQLDSQKEATQPHRRWRHHLKLRPVSRSLLKSQENAHKDHPSMRKHPIELKTSNLMEWRESLILWCYILDLSVPRRDFTSKTNITCTYEFHANKRHLYWCVTSASLNAQGWKFIGKGGKWRSIGQSATNAGINWLMWPVGQV